MSDYEAGKDVVLLQGAVEELKGLIAQVYTIIEHNIKKGKLEEPKVKKE